MQTNTKGFSLIELMVAVAIVAILASIAIPSYQNHLRETRRTEATSALQKAAAAEEKFFLSNNTYTTDFTALGMPVDVSLQSPTENGYYVLDIVAADASGYTIAALPATNSAQVADTACQMFLIDGTGRLTARNGAVDVTASCVRR